MDKEELREKIKELVGEEVKPRNWVFLGVVFGFLGGFLGASTLGTHIYQENVRKVLQEADTRPEIHGFDLYKPINHEAPEIPPPFKI